MCIQVCVSGMAGVSVCGQRAEVVSGLRYVILCPCLGYAMARMLLKTTCAARACEA